MTVPVYKGEDGKYRAHGYEQTGWKFMTQTAAEGKKVTYRKYTPEDGKKNVEKGQEWTYWVIRKEAGKETMWLNRIENAGRQDACYTWLTDEKRALRFGRLDEAEAFAEKTRGMTEERREKRK